MMILRYLCISVAAGVTRKVVEAFSPSASFKILQQRPQQQRQQRERAYGPKTWMLMPETSSDAHYDHHLSSRRSLLQQSTILVASALAGLSRPDHAVAAAAAERPPLEALLYTILRVREATQQETRLITTGKFKDVQRANVKLAIKFMIENYRLADTFVAASTYLDGGYQRRIEAGQVGQSAVQNLYTILEYFDAADVQNIKVGSDSMSGGKEQLVLKGLDATKKSIDDFLAYFPKAQVDEVRQRVQQENELNMKEFDSSLGTIVNMPASAI